MSPTTQVGRWAARLLLCLATAVAIAATAYLCAWLNCRGYYARSQEHVRTRGDLASLRADLERRKDAIGAWPERLTDLPVVKDKQVRVDETGEPVDGWGRPFHYRVEAGGYVLYSHGRDGKPGGLGQYADLYAGREDTWPERPTLWEFTALREALPVQLACAFAGVVAFPLCLLQAQGQPGTRPALAKVLLANAVTAAFAVLAALMMSALHTMPGGH